MAARNFFEEDPSILYPRIDIAGEKSGITAMEFPFLNYLIYLTSLVFGYAHWYGRLINLIVSSIGIFYFYKLILKYFDQQLAFNAAFILLFSVWFNYSRKIMPDTFSMSFVIAGIYYGSNYFDKRSNLINLILYFLLSLIGVLSKLPSAYILLVFLFFSINPNYSFQKKIVFSIASLVLVFIISIYYFYWCPYLTKTYDFTHFFMGTSIHDGFIETIQHLDRVSEKFYLEALQIVGFFTFSAGIILAYRNKNSHLLWVFSLCFTGFLFVILKAGFGFYAHSYYIIPFAPIMALMAAYAVLQIKNKKVMVALLAVIASENILNKTHDYYIKQKNIEIISLESSLDKISKRNDLILINSGKVPTPMYFAHRRGWVETNEMLSNTLFVDSLKQKGLKFIVILKKTFGTNVNLQFEIVFDNDAYKIYKI